MRAERGRERPAVRVSRAFHSCKSTGILWISKRLHTCWKHTIKTTKLGEIEKSVCAIAIFGFVIAKWIGWLVKSEPKGDRAIVWIATAIWIDFFFDDNQLAILVAWTETATTTPPSSPITRPKNHNHFVVCAVFGNNGIGARTRTRGNVPANQIMRARLRFLLLRHFLCVRCVLHSVRFACSLCTASAVRCFGSFLVSCGQRTVEIEWVVGPFCKWCIFYTIQLHRKLAVVFGISCARFKAIHKRMQYKATRLFFLSSSTAASNSEIVCVFVT